VAKPFPRTVEGLLELLDSTFPEPAFTPSDSRDLTMYASGQRSVVSFIRRGLDRAKKRDPDNLVPG